MIGQDVQGPPEALTKVNTKRSAIEELTDRLRSVNIGVEDTIAHLIQIFENMTGMSPVDAEPGNPPTDPSGRIGQLEAEITRANRNLSSLRQIGSSFQEL